MMPGIPYGYSFERVDPENPDDVDVAHGRASIMPIRMEDDIFEGVIDACGSSFHIIVGRQINGNFLCMPSHGVGCEMARLSDRYWNQNSLTGTNRVGCQEAAAIVDGIAFMDSFLRVN